MQDLKIKFSNIILILILILVAVYALLVIVQFGQTITLAGVEGYDPVTGEYLEHMQRWETFWTSVNLWLQGVWRLTTQLATTSIFLTIPGAISYWLENKVKEGTEIGKGD